MFHMEQYVVLFYRENLYKPHTFVRKLVIFDCRARKERLLIRTDEPEVARPGGQLELISQEMLGP